MCVIAIICFWEFQNSKCNRSDSVFLFSRKSMLGNRFKLKRKRKWSLGCEFRGKQWSISVVDLNTELFRLIDLERLASQILDHCRERDCFRAIGSCDWRRTSIAITTTDEQRLFGRAMSEKADSDRLIWLAIVKILTKWPKHSNKMNNFLERNLL